MKNMENSEVFRLATELGKALKEDERLIRLADAKKAYQNDEAVQSALREYEADQQAIQDELVKPDKDMLLVDRLQTRTEELYRQITGAESFLALNEAQKTVNDLMNAVNNTITFTVTGEMPAWARMTARPAAEDAIRNASSDREAVLICERVRRETS